MSGVELVAAERKRQMEVEGWTPEHDARHVDGELIEGARAYAWASLCMIAFGANERDLRIIPNDFPKDWDKSWWKPSPDPVHNLVKAGALIAAEIDRLQRGAQSVGAADASASAGGDS